MAGHLKENFGVSTTLTPGRNGIFEVRVNGTVVAKKTLDGFPDDTDVVRAVGAALAR